MKKEFQLQDRVRVVSGKWKGVTGLCVNWWRDPRANANPSFQGGPSFHGAEILMDEDCLGKFTGPAIRVVVARCEDIRIA